MEDTEEINGKSSETIAQELPQKKLESRDEVLSRHRKEISDLQSKETEMKKSAAKGSKAEQKLKKKQVEEEISRLSAALKERHSDELSSLGYNSSKPGNENLVQAIAGVSVNAGAQEKSSSKGAKRRQKRAQQEAEREQRIQEEQSSIVSDRAVEDEKLRRKLEPLGLAVREIKPDGHCLYRAIEHQLGGAYDFQKLREMAADYMRTHVDDFVPFFLAEKESSASDPPLPERFERYCKEVATTAAWGGQLELEALTRCLRRHIAIFSGSFPDVEMGKEYEAEPSIRLSFHRHAFGLGEHYNSVVPI